MTDFYYKLVKAGKMMLEEVPIKWRELVRERLKEGQKK